MSSTPVQEKTTKQNRRSFIDLYICGLCAFCQALRQTLEEMQLNGQVGEVYVHYTDHRSLDTGQDDWCAPTMSTQTGSFEGTAEIHFYFLEERGYHISPEGEIERDQTKKAPVD